MKTYIPEFYSEKKESIAVDFIVDEIDQQVEELYYINHPTKRSDTTDPEEIIEYKKKLVGEDISKFGTWVYYPWNGHLVHFLPEELHQQLRTARNKNLITSQEQEIFYRAHIGITGLSVGNSAMATTLYTGGGRHMRLADFDILAASNLNRIRSSFVKLGMKKVHAAAQEIYEINPYAELELYSDGITNTNIRSFLTQPKPLDILIEEMDSIYLKIQIRLLARELRIPVIMAADNGDNVVLDVERFDLEPERQLFHGDIPEQELLSVTPAISKPEAARMITRFVHPENVATRMKLSLMELGKTLYSWPQLGNAAFLAGCSLAYTARKIICGSSLPSGKYLISLDEHLVKPFLTKADIETQDKISTDFLHMLHL